MREIKFRVWITENPVDKSWMHYCDLKTFDDINGSNDIMQFTSLLDKNGVEIWEGDIVRVNIKTDKDVVWLKRQAEIVWESPGFVLDYTRGLRGDLHIGRCPIEGKKDLEVIGNIYENPDLIGI